MQAVRALAILTGLATVGGGDITPDEEVDLMSFGFVSWLDEAGYSALRGQAQELTRRQSEARAALGSASRLRSPEDRRRVQESSIALEEAAQAQVRLGGFRANPPTGRYLALTEKGRQAATDLTVWQARLPGVELVHALEWLNALRGRFQSDIRSARTTLDQFEQSGGAFLTLTRLRNEFGPTLPPGRKLKASDLDPALRSSALILAMGDLGLNYNSAPFKAATEVMKSGPPTPTLPIAASLVSVMRLADNGADYPALLREVETRFGHRGDAPLLAAALVDLRPTDLPGVLARLDRVRGLGFGDDPFVLLTLARSLQPPETLAARMTWLATAIRPVGAPPDPDSTLAAAILAASSYEPPEAASRHAEILRRIGTTLEHPTVAAATLAEGPFSPAESWFLLGEASAAVARGGFFDTVLEIDKLGLLLFDHLRPPAFGEPGAAARVLPFGAAAVGAAGFLWVARFAAFHDLPVVVDVLAHPEHAHTVAGFG